MKLRSLKPVQKRTRRRGRQLSWLPTIKDSLGGMRRETHAKVARPLDSGKPLHVCMRSEQAKGAKTMQGRNRLKVDGIVASTSKKMSVRLVKYVNVGNHLHLVVKLPGRGMIARRQYAKWIRALTGLIAYEIGGASKGGGRNDAGGRSRGRAETTKFLASDSGAGVKVPRTKKFWDSRPFTRVVHGLRGFKIIDRYVLKNEFEAMGWPKEAAIRLAREHFESAAIAARGKLASG